MGDDTDLIYIIYWPDTDLCVQNTGMPSNPATNTLCSQKHTRSEICTKGYCWSRCSAKGGKAWMVRSVSATLFPFSVTIKNEPIHSLPQSQFSKNKLIEWETENSYILFPLNQKTFPLSSFKPSLKPITKACQLELQFFNGNLTKLWVWFIQSLYCTPSWWLDAVGKVVNWLRSLPLLLNLFKTITKTLRITCLNMMNNDELTMTPNLYKNAFLSHG